jgi:hypothetical protein
MHYFLMCLVYISIAIVIQYQSRKFEGFMRFEPPGI